MKYLILIIFTLSLTSCTCHFKDSTELGIRSNFDLGERRTEK